MKIFKFIKSKMGIFTLSALLLTSVVSCGTQGTTNSDTSSTSKKYPEKIVMTYVTSPLNVPSIIEKNQSIFENHLKESGKNIKVEYAEITSGADQVQALASGDVQILYAVGATSIVSAASNGADIKVLNMYSRSPGAYAIYSNEEIKSPEDLRGKTIGGPVGTNLHQLLVAYLEKAGMSINDVNYVNMSVADAKVSLDSKSVDAALIAGPTAQLAKNQGYNLVTDGVGLLDAPIAVATTSKFLNENKELLENFREAQEKTYKYIMENKDEVIKTVADTLGLSVSDVEEMYPQYDFNINITEEDKQAFKNVADFMYKNGMIENEFDINNLF